MKFVSNVRAVEMVEVIRVESITGEGTPVDPIRSIVEYYSKDGELLARADQLGDERRFSMADK